jgi:YgiT-type zinc finger domain-containing protein
MKTNWAKPIDSCEFCAGQVEHRTICAPFHYKGETIYVEHVPVWVCRRCGEQYFDAPAYKRLEQLAKARRRIKKTITFPLAEYDAALA